MKTAITDETYTDAQRILSTYIHSETNVRLVCECIAYKSQTSAEFEKYVYEVVGMLLVEPTITKHTIQRIIQDIYHDRVSWMSRIFDTYRTLENEEIEFTENPCVVVEGVLECGKCKSRRTFSFQRQTRSADEGATTFAQCAQCGNRWRFNN